MSAQGVSAARSKLRSYMLTKGDIADIICEHLPGSSGQGAVAPVKAASRPVPKRVFISDWELRKLFKPGQKTVKIPSNAIVSPLSLDWLDYAGVEVLRD
jgi:hypothetical protein